MVVADEAIAAALASAGDDVSAADALRPALEAAAETLGSGVLDTAEIVPLGDFFADPDVEAFALVGDDGARPSLVRHPGARERPSGGHPSRADGRCGRALAHAPSARCGAGTDRRDRPHAACPCRQVLDLVPGTVLELDRAAGSPADVMVNGRIVARGEVVVVDEDYGIRITEIVSTESGQ